MGWKYSFLLPVPKVSSITSMSDLRPISILPTLSKIFERVLESQLREYINKHSLLPPIQSGFRKNHSCTTALLKVTDDILEAADRGDLTGLVLLDYSRAFDKLNHQLLLAILKFLGLECRALKLVESYLSDRTQSVRLNGTLSSVRHINCGVPQGSILGPLFFILYTSQLDSGLRDSTSLRLYADDTQVYMSFQPGKILEANAILSSELSILLKTSSNHCLDINPNKCYGLLFGRIQARDQYEKLFSVSLDGKRLNSCKSARNLGVIMDTHLRFTEHINKCIKKAFINLKLIYNQRYILNPNLKKKLCDTLVLSQFTYCDSLYGPCILDHDAKRIQRLQNCCIRLIGSIKKYDTGITNKMAEIGWLNMAGRRKFHSYLLIYKIINNKSPCYLFDKIKFRYDEHSLDLRHKFNIAPPIHRTTLYERSFSYQACILYNRISVNLKINSYLKFKSSIRQLIFNSSI